MNSLVFFHFQKEGVKGAGTGEDLCLSRFTGVGPHQWAAQSRISHTVIYTLLNILLLLAWH